MTVNFREGRNLQAELPCSSTLSCPLTVMLDLRLFVWLTHERTTPQPGYAQPQGSGVHHRG